MSTANEDRSTEPREQQGHEQDQDTPDTQEQREAQRRYLRATEGRRGWR